MRLSGINYNIVGEMDKILVNSVCLVLFCSTVFTNDVIFTTNTGTRSDFSVTQMSKNLSHVPMGSEDVELLNIAYNQITRLPDNIFLENNYRQVKKMFLYRNHIGNISTHAFKGLKQLKILDLSDNNITSLDPYTFKGNNKLEKLILMNNYVVFSRAQTFIVSHTIDTLVLSNNNIEEIFDLTFLGVPNLRRLILSDNKLTTLASSSFRSLTKLHYLSLSNTGVHKLSESMFIKLPRIINLESTPLAKSFEPPLRQVTDESVTALLKINKFVY